MTEKENKIPTEPLYISLHIEKTAGSSFYEVLKNHFGSSLQLAYDDPSVVTEPKCIHGHFIFDRFRGAIEKNKDAKWITFLREPLTSAISYYFFLKNTPNVAKAFQFRDQGIEEWLTHTKPMRWPNPHGYFHNRYAMWFGKKAIDEYSFVGVTEQFDESLFLLFYTFQWKPVFYKKENVGNYKAPDLKDSVIKKFMEINEADYQIYNYAVSMLEERKTKYGLTYDPDLSIFLKGLDDYQANNPC